MTTIAERRTRSRKSRYPSRRRFPRVILSCEGFFESRNRMLIGKLSDLSLRGAFIHTPVPDSPGTPAILRLELPGFRTLLRLQTEVVHSQPEPDGKRPGMGVRFIGTQPWQLKRLASVLLRRAGYRGLGLQGLEGRIEC